MSFIKKKTQNHTYLEFFRRQENFFFNHFDRKALKRRILPNEEPEITFNEKWLLNFTDVDLPIEFKLLLSLGEKHAINKGIENTKFFELIADVENALRAITDEESRNAARGDITTLIKNYISKGNQLSVKDKFFNKLVEKTTKFVKDYKLQRDSKEILIARSDKCKQTVVLYKEAYHEGMMKLLNDSNSYRPTNSDPTKRMTQKCNKLMNKLVDTKVIEKRQKFNMVLNNAVPPKIYGLVKSHKPGISKDNIILRPVVSYVGSPLYPLSKFLGKIIGDSLQNQFTVKNSY